MMHLEGLSRAEQLARIERCERREDDRRKAARAETMERRTLPSFDEQVRHIEGLMAQVDWSPVEPMPVPELIVPGREGGRWVGSFSDSWGEGR